MVQVTVAAFI